MKKLFLSILLIAGVSMIFAQKSNVSTADRLTQQDKPNFKGARESIKPALTDESTKNDPKTYYTAGMIGFKENEALLTEMYLQKDINQKKKGEAIIESYNYFIKANELDMLPNKRGKIRPKYTRRIKENLKTYYTDQLNLINYGAVLFDGKEYDKAFEVFQIFLSIPKLPLMKNEIPTNDSTYHMIQYFSGLAATNSKKHKEAIKIYEDLKNVNYENKNVYQLLTEEYKNAKDTVKYMSTLKEGFDKFKDDPWFLQNIINHYINTEQIEQASNYLNAAIEQAPNIPEYYYVKGNIEDRLGNTEEARKAFDKAVELKPDYAEGYFGIGRLIYNQAVEMLKAADTIKDNKTYNQEVEKANLVFKQSKPFLEKAVELNPNDNDFKQTLKMLYYRLGENEKYEAL